MVVDSWGWRSRILILLWIGRLLYDGILLVGGVVCARHHFQIRVRTYLVFVEME